MVELDKETVKMGLNTISKGFRDVLEYNELDLIWFLSLKKRFWYYRPILYLKSFLIILVILILFLEELLFSNLIIETQIVLIIVSLLFVLVDYLYFYKFRYSLWYFRKRRDFMIQFNNQLKLIINNIILERDVIDVIKRLRNEELSLSSRINSFSSMIKPFRTFLENFGYMVTIIVPLITFFIDIVNKIILNLDSIDPLVLNIILGNFVQFLVNLTLFGIIALNLNHRRFYSEKKYLIHLEGLIEVILLGLITMIKIVEFPDEKKKGEMLEKDIKNWKLKEESIT